MREIKFRQWSSDRFHYWGCSADNFTSPLSNRLDIPSEQFTGLHDKNGKEIYEGDMRRGGYVVKYLPNKASFMWVSQTTKDTVFIRSICSEDEVIGNIHENPELLEVTK